LIFSIGEKHRLENRGKIPLQMIEVQVGDYLGEDDIERFDDAYGRMGVWNKEREKPKMYFQNLEASMV